MCLSSLNFSTKYNNKSHSYTAFGFKSIRESDVLVNGKIKASLKKWQRAEFNQSFNKITPSRTVFIENDGDLASLDKTYHPGFHIFISKSDAENYHSLTKNKIIVRVEYKNIIAFGKQRLFKRPFKVDAQGNLIRSYGECVVAEYMRIIEVVK